MKRKLKILIANGVNLDLLGNREPEHYGKLTLTELEKDIRDAMPKICNASTSAKVELSFFQSNSESSFLEEVSKQWDGAVINPGAWTHTSLALGDRLLAAGLPYIEVHMSNTASRETFRHFSYISKGAQGTITGLGKTSYLTGIFALLTYLESQL